MKKLFLVTQLFLLLIVGTLNSCKKSASKETTVTIVVKDNLGKVLPNWTVYQISDTKYNLYGADDFFKDQQSVTATDGVATLKIDKLDFATGGQRTYYFFANYSISGVNKSKTVGITLSEGDSKSGTLILN